jgi:4-amino-4-deoxy-L-arabinose transferase-like glycosyltransferase
MRSQLWLNLAALLIAGVMLFAGLGQLALMQSDEGRNATVAREMKVSGNWLVPTFNGLAYLDKPAFFFKCAGIAMSLFGETEMAARLPSAVAGFALLVLVYAFCRREFGPRCAALAVIVTATTPLYFAFARLVIVDMMLAFFVSAAILAGYIAEEHRDRARRRWYLLGAAAAGCATLVKGPVGFTLPVVVLLVFNRGAWKRLVSPWNMLIFFAIVLPWFIGLSLARPDFPQYGIMQESLGRFTTKMYGRWEPWYFYGQVIAVAFLAWSVLLPESAWVAWRARRNWARAERLCIVWAVVVVLFFSISASKLPGYVLTVAVALGILIARVFERAFERADGRAARVVRHSVFGLMAVLVLAAGLILFVIARPSDATSRLVPHPWLPLAVLIVLALVGMASLWKRHPGLAFAAFAMLPMTVGAASLDGIKQYAESRSARSLASWIAGLPSPVEVVCVRSFPSSLPFYLKRPIPLVDEDGHELASNYILHTLRQTHQWPSILVREDQCEAWLAGRTGSVLLVANRRKKLDSIADNHGVTVTEIVPGYWGALLPAPGHS